MGKLAVLLAPTPLDHDEQLAAEITLLAGQINAANYRLLKLIAEFDDRKGWSGGGTVRSCAHWLNWKVGIALGAAREKVRVAHGLQQLPLIDAAFATGEISYSKVRAMTRVATPDNEDFLLTIARYGTASHVEQVVNKYRGVQCSQDDSEAEEQEQARKLVYYQDDGGMWVIHARLPAEAGGIVVKAIEAVAKPVQAARQEQLQQQPRDVSAGTEIAAETSVKAERLHDLVMLCRYHHRKLHEGAFGIKVNDTGDEMRLVFSTPSGKSIQQTVFPQFKSVPAETRNEYLSKLAPEVHSGTAVSRWQGEDCDYGMAIDALLQRDWGNSPKHEPQSPDTISSSAS